MTNTVTFPTSLGGDGLTYTDDDDASTGLDGGGWRTRFVPALSGAVAMGNSAAASAISAINAPGTNATSTTPNAIVSTGTISLTLAQTGKAFAVGQYVVVADTAAPATNYMIGQISAFNAGTGAMSVAVSASGGSGTKTAWTISLTARPGTSPAWVPIASGSFSGTAVDLNSIPQTYSSIRLRWAGASGDAGSGIQFLAFISNDNNATRSSNSVPLSTAGWGGSAVFNGQLDIDGYANGTSAMRVVGFAGAVATTQINTPDSDVCRLLAHPGGLNALRLTPATGNFDAGTYVLEGRP